MLQHTVLVHTLTVTIKAHIIYILVLPETIINTHLIWPMIVQAIDHISTCRHLGLSVPFRYCCSYSC